MYFCVFAGFPRMTERILQLVRERCGVDLAAYRAQTLERRVRNRMLSLGLADVADYERVLDTAAGEAARLLERITIKVSRFYRNAGTFDVVAQRLLPELARGGPVSAWSAGCGRGEEAWTLAMLLEADAIAGTVVATDLDDEALGYARAGLYPASAAAELPERLRDRYLAPEGTRLRVIPRLRARVRFERFDHSLAAPPGPFQLVACRNLLIYWARDTQEAILRHVVAATAAEGFVVLGESEWPVGEAAAWLAEVPGAPRIFRRLAAGGAKP